MGGRDWDAGVSPPIGTSVAPELPFLPHIPTKGDLPNYEPIEKWALVQQFPRWIEPPCSEADEPGLTATEATESHLADLDAEIRTHSQYFNPESRNDSGWISWVQEALGDEWSEHLAKMENFERERAAWQKRKEDLEKQRLDECRVEVVRGWMEKQVQGWEYERKRWADEEDYLGRENALTQWLEQMEQRRVEKEQTKLEFELEAERRRAAEEARVQACSTPPTVQVTFNVTATTRWGENIFLTGSLDPLKNWSPANALLLSPANYPTWSITVTLPANVGFKYKYIRKFNSSVTWECDPDNHHQTPASGLLTINEKWR